jgi:xeroderma pigmentosum group C-complementing protein
VSSDEFEDALPALSSKRRKLAHEEQDDEVEWEDAIQPGAPSSTTTAARQSGDLELVLDGTVHIGSLTNPYDKKKGPSKIERQIRVSTHCMHVQFLLFHNLIRSGWACDKKVQSILVGQLPAGVKKEIDKWKAASGINPAVAAEAPKASCKGRKGRKAAQNERNQRDWGRPAERQERGAPNMSRGDPLLRLLKILAAYWRKRFTITAPGLRKQGYKSLTILEEAITSYRNDKYDVDGHGERVRNVQDFRDLARSCEGSRDVGAQLFTALVRGLGLEARLVASLQPVGFGWSKNEEASANKKKALHTGDPTHAAEMSDSGEELGSEVSPPKTSALRKQEAKSKALRKTNGKTRVSRGGKDAPINLSEESDHINLESDDEDASVIDVTPSMPRQRPNMNYDKDLPYPTYWTEVISPITNHVYPVDPLVLTPAVATSDDLLSSFESRGAKADKAKQVFAYIVAYSLDGSAKDVTTRYLKRHMWPGRTKGVRMPIEKVPIYNRRGKIIRYEDYDWFKTVMSGYNRTETMRTVVDDLEEAKDLKPVKPERKEPKLSEDTLQGYKSSAEYVLERHLRREEALRPGSKPVKTFTTGKGDNAKEEPVFRRMDVEVCRTGESWHKEGRAIKEGELPMKMVPIRAVTLTRKREVEEAERDSGEKLKQGLYSWDQTDWIIPPPIENGVIPKNAFGNMDCYVPTMVPKGAVHIPLRSTVRICKRLGIDYAEAVTGFEFGNKRAVPVITGVVVAEENEYTVIDIWEKEEEERKIKEEGKREKAALTTWRKWLMGLRIVQRVREEYGQDADAHMKEEMNPFTNQNRKKNTQAIHAGELPQQQDDVNAHPDEDTGGGFIAEDDFEGGGFLPEGHEEEETPHTKHEFTIEGVPEPTKNGFEPGLRLTVPLARAMNGNEHASDLSSPEHTDPQPAKQTPKTKPATNGKKALTPNQKRKKANAPKKATSNGRKRKASTPPRPASIKTARAAPKRKAARKSVTAVKSHYFEHSSDDSDGGDSGSSSSEDEVFERPRKRVDKASDSIASTNGRSLRARRSM